MNGACGWRTHVSSQSPSQPALRPSAALSASAWFLPATARLTWNLWRLSIHYLLWLAGACWMRGAICSPPCSIHAVQHSLAWIAHLRARFPFAVRRRAHNARNLRYLTFAIKSYFVHLFSSMVVHYACVWCLVGLALLTDG